MTKKRFIIESERIGSTYSIHIFKDDEVIFEISNWNSLSNMHKKECEEFVDYLNNITNENEQLKQLLDYADDLIQSHLSERYIRQWRNFKTGHKEYNDFWEEKLKKHKELKEDVE